MTDQFLPLAIFGGHDMGHRQSQFSHLQPPLPTVLDLHSINHRTQRFQLCGSRMGLPRNTGDLKLGGKPVYGRCQGREESGADQQPVCMDHEVQEDSHKGQHEQAQRKLMQAFMLTMGQEVFAGMILILVRNRLLEGGEMLAQVAGGIGEERRRDDGVGFDHVPRIFGRR